MKEGRMIPVDVFKWVSDQNEAVIRSFSNFEFDGGGRNPAPRITLPFLINSFRTPRSVPKFPFPGKADAVRLLWLIAMNFPPSLSVVAANRSSRCWQNTEPRLRSRREAGCS